MTDHILIIDADAGLRESLECLLAAGDYTLLAASDAASAFARIDASLVDVVLCELGMPGLDGLDLIPQLGRRLPGVPVILMSPLHREELAAEASRRGAHDYLQKPFSDSELQFALKSARRGQRLRQASELLQRDVVRAVGERPIVAASPPMIALLELMERTASFKTAALLSGESGTGKEVLARAIHAQSPRRREPFVAVSCGGVPENHLEAALCGHTKGALAGSDRAAAGWFLAADGGSLFLEGIEQLPEALQTKLVRVLQEEEVQPLGGSKKRKVDVRLIAATAADLAAEVQSGHFSAELFSRLSVMHLKVPALRERRQDIPLLVDHFLARFRERLGHGRIRIADEALARLTAYTWPGNVRELESVVERAIIHADAGRITLRQLPADIVAARDLQAGNDSDAASAATQTEFCLKQTRKNAEAAVIERALSATGGNRTHAAKLLGISHRALLYKIKDYQIRN